MSRLSIEQVEALPTKRIISYLKTVRNIRYNHVCGCCFMPLWDVRDYSDEERKKMIKSHEEDCKYIEEIYIVLNARKDRKEVEEEINRKNLLKAAKRKKKRYSGKKSSRKKYEWGVIWNSITTLYYL